MTKPAYIAGSAVVPFRRYRDGSTWRDWVRVAGRGALADAQLLSTDIDALVVASESDFFSLQLAPGPVVADELGLEGVATTRVEGGGASGALALRTAYSMLTSGFARRILVIGFEATASHLGADDVRLLYGLSFDAELEGFLGASATALYALSMKLHMARYGTQPADFARVAVSNRMNAVGNPWAHKPMRLSEEDVLQSPLVAEPYRRFDCSLLSDGAAAVVLTTDSGAIPHGRPKVGITGSGAATDRTRLGDRDSPEAFAAKSTAALQAYAMAGLKDPLRELDCAEIYDAYSGAQLQAIEALGLAEPGQAGADHQAGAFAAQGELPINLSGGLLGQGGAPGATGIVQILTVARLLEGRYHAHHQPDRELEAGLVDTHGGVCTNAVVHILRRMD